MYPRLSFHFSGPLRCTRLQQTQVLRAHILCAAAECPLGVPSLGDVTDAALFGGQGRLQEVRLNPPKTFPIRFSSRQA